MTDDFKGMSLVIHGGREAVAVALVRLQRVAWDYYKHPGIEQSEWLLKELSASKQVVEDRNPTPAQ